MKKENKSFAILGAVIAFFAFWGWFKITKHDKIATGVATVGFLTAFILFMIESPEVSK